MSSGYYSEQDMDDYAARVKTAPEDYPARAAQSTAAMLRKHPSAYKRYGVYWWGLKTLLRKYIHDGSWYCGPETDAVMETRANHGSEFRNALAALVYFDHHPLADSKAQWEDSQGVIHPYTLMDIDAPS